MTPRPIATTARRFFTTSITTLLALLITTSVNAQQDDSENAPKRSAMILLETYIVEAVMKDENQSFADWMAEFSDSEEKSKSNPAVPQAVSFFYLADDMDVKAAIGKLVKTDAANLLANPVIVTLENHEARINITTDFPAKSKNPDTPDAKDLIEIGTTIEMTPKVLFDKTIIVDFNAKQSDLTGVSKDGRPIVARRNTQTTFRLDSGQTVALSGLKRSQDGEGQVIQEIIFVTCKIVEPDKNNRADRPERIKRTRNTENSGALKWRKPADQ